MKEETLFSSNKWITISMMTLVSLSFFVFTIMPEFYNGLVLDDLIFYNQLQEMNIFQYVVWYWRYWEGTYVAFFEHGIQYRLYGIFNSTIPYALLLYVAEIVLVSISLRMISKIRIVESVLVAMIIWGLFLFCIPDMSSYYWNCTRGYALTIAITVWLLSKVFTYGREVNIWDYVKIFFASLFVGCSSPVFAPLILVVLGCFVLKLFVFDCKFSFKFFFCSHSFVFVTFVLCTIFFFLEVASPGNWARREVHSALVTNAAQSFFPILLSGIVQVLKMVFFKMHYYLILFFISVFFFISTGKNSELSFRLFLKRTLYRIVISCALLLLSMVLCEFACGHPMIGRAFAHLPMAIFIVIILTARDLCRTSFFSANTPKTIEIIGIVCLSFLICNNIFAIYNAYGELENYKVSLNSRMSYLNSLQQNGNTETVHLEPLDGAEFNAIPDVLIRKVMPSYSRIPLLPSNEIANTPEHCYNQAFRKYYNFNFDAVTDLVWEGV